jgi:KaiC/GvpD/RAD55 family RecA-like ATPase
MFHSDIDLTIPRGSIILLSGSPLSGISTITKYISLDALERNEAIIYITTKDTGEKVQRWFSERTSTDGLGIVDCISKSLRLETNIEDTEKVKYVSSAVDLTGISVKYSALLEQFWNIEKYKDIRIIIDSLSTLLMYSHVQTVFRFLHILTGRIRKIEGYGIFTLDKSPEIVETESINHLIDTVAIIEDNKIFFRGFGLKKDLLFSIEDEKFLIEGKK